MSEQHQQLLEGASAPPPQSHQEANTTSDSQQHSMQQPEQQPVNFGGSANSNAVSPAGASSYTSRRVTIGGMHNNNNNASTADRRGSFGAGLDDFFTGGRRGSLGFDAGMDALFGRRGSMDSTTAALDAAILDLSRRRYSVAPGGANDLGVPPPPPGAGMQSVPSMGLQSMSSMGSMGMGGAMSSMNYQGYNMVNPNSLAARQQQLQQQQRELEQRQKELEIQRQQLIANMQDRNYMGMPSGPPQTIAAPYMPQSSGSLGLGGSMRGNSLDISGRGLSLDMSQRGPMDVSHRSMDASHRAPLDMSHRSALDASHRSGVSQASSGSQWWICQICNAKAFSSHQEALAHEETCQAGHRRQMDMFGMDNSMNRNFSLGLDGSTHSAYEPPTGSRGPFSSMEEPLPLSMDHDKDWLTPLHCFVRRHCVEVFTASEKDVATPSKGKRKPITVGQVGIRCPHCHDMPSMDTSTSSKGRERGSVYYPTTISSIYNATMNLLQRHLHSCTAVPDDIMRRYETLKADDARSGTSKRYWIESALSLGLVDTAMGIRYCDRHKPPLPALTDSQEQEGHSAVRRNSNDFFSSSSNAVTDGKDGKPASEQKPAARVPAGESVSKSEQDMAQSAPLVTPEDKPYATNFSYHLLSQMQPCVFTEADRLGKRKGLPPGFPGLACRHCFGGYGSGRFFPSSIKTLSDTSKTLNVLHNHMMRCRKCPSEIRESLENLRGTHDEERAKMKFGSQKAFFARIWDRLHGKDAPPVAHKRKKPMQAKFNMSHQQAAFQMEQQHRMVAAHRQMVGLPPQTAPVGAPVGGMDPMMQHVAKRQKS